MRRLALLLALAALLGGCGGSDAEPASPGGTTTGERSRYGYDDEP